MTNKAQRASYRKNLALVIAITLTLAMFCSCIFGLYIPPVWALVLVIFMGLMMVAGWYQYAEERRKWKLALREEQE